MKYDFTAIEAKWHKIWDEKHLYAARTGSDAKKFYALVEFPYPSGAGLHHVRVQISHAGQHQKTRCLDNGAIGLQMGCDRRKAAVPDEDVGLRGRSCFEIGEHCTADQQHRSASAAAVNSRPRACASIGAAAPVA